MIAIKNAIASMRSHKLRVFIAMVWIVIGITAVVAVSSVGKGLENQINKLVEKSDDGSTILTFYPKDYNIAEVGLVYQPFGGREREIISLIPGVKSVTTDIEDNSSRQGEWWMGIQKDNEYYTAILTSYDMEKRPKVILAGRDFSLDDLDRDTILLSENTAYLYFDTIEEAVGEFINLEGRMYEVIGIVPTDFSEGFMYSQEEPRSYIPPALMEELMGAYTDKWNHASTRIKIGVGKGFDKQMIIQEVIQKLNDSRENQDGEYVEDYREDPAENLRYLKSMISKFTGAATLVSLIIGGIGIMNIMYMSVIERKREIGIRRAIGAKSRNIIMQFVTEAAVITTIGGFFGIIVGIIVSFAIQDRIPFDIAIDPVMCIFAAAISALTGMIFGVIPALKATKVDPIKAIQG